MSDKLSMVVVTALFAVGMQSAEAQDEHGQEEHGKPAEFKMPATYKDAVKEIEYRLHEIEELMAAQHLDQVHVQADVIRKVANQIGQLAAKSDSGVPKEAVKEINAAGKELAGKFEAIDKTGDAGDAAGTQKIYDEMVKISASLARYVAKAYQCPMKCEGEKTYDKPGKCPKCGMELQEVKLGQHGGVLKESADHEHSVEATLSPQGELRIYCCDEHEKAVTADKFAAECRACKSGGSEAEAKAVALVPAPDKSFLSGKVDASIKTPLTAKVTIDFKDGQKPQAFQFDFAEPTIPAEKSRGETPSKEEHGHGGH